MKRSGWVRNSPHACGSTPKACGRVGKIPTPEMEEYLKRRMMSIMLSLNWVCAGSFDDHEWVDV